MNNDYSDQLLEPEHKYEARVVSYESGMVVVRYDDGKLNKFFNLADRLQSSARKNK